MATVVLVHGIAQEHNGPATLEQQWLPALADGVSKFGVDALAKRLWSGGHGDINVRMAYYGGTFIQPGAQGGTGDIDYDISPLSNDLNELRERLAEAWLETAAKYASDPSDRRQAERDLAIVRNQVGRSMGVRAALGRPTINALARLRWFAPFGMAVARTFVWRALTQATLYLGDENIRAYAQQQVLKEVQPETRLIIGHSLGSVVAYEAMHRALDGGNLSAKGTVTLITLGSPLGLRGVVYEHLRPKPPGVPPTANRWANFAAKDDLVATQLDLALLFPPANDKTVKVERHIINNGSQPHSCVHYLTNPAVGRVVVDSLAGI